MFAKVFSAILASMIIADATAIVFMIPDRAILFCRIFAATSLSIGRLMGLPV